MGSIGFNSHIESRLKCSVQLPEHDSDLVQESKAQSKQEFIDELKSGQYDDVSVIFRSNASSPVRSSGLKDLSILLNLVCQFSGSFDAEIASHLPKGLKYICHNGAGYDTIDTSACRNRGNILHLLPPRYRGSNTTDILISNTPKAPDSATADIGIFLMLGALRQVYTPLDGLMNHGAWNRPVGHDPEGKTLGILGMGGIGRVSQQVS